MDFCRNFSVSGGVPSRSQSEQLLSSSSCSNKLGTLDELFSNHSTAEGDVSLEWLSIFVEDCFSNRGNHCLPPAAAEAESEAPTTNELQKKKTSSVDIIAAASKPRQQQDRSTSSSLQKFVIPVKARSKRKRGPIIKSRTQASSNCWSHMTGCSSDPPLLQQAYWLADSELIFPKKEDDSISTTTTTTSSSRDRDGGCGKERGGKDEKEVKEEAMVVVGGGGKDKRGGRRLELVDEGGSNANIGGQQQQQQARRCSHCLAQRTPQWRAGPLGPKTLCNACGVRFKSGRLLPEYRPAKSPTFVSYKHSNSHKKVLEMRQSSMALHLPPSSIPTHQC